MKKKKPFKLYIIYFWGITNQGKTINLLCSSVVLSRVQTCLKLHSPLYTSMSSRLTTFPLFILFIASLPCFLLILSHPLHYILNTVTTFSRYSLIIKHYLHVVISECCVVMTPSASNVGCSSLYIQHEYYPEAKYLTGYMKQPTINPWHDFQLTVQLT